MSRATIAFVLAVSALGLGWAPLADAQPAAPRPHILYIVADDQGWKDYGIEPFRAAVRRGSWKLVWQATLPTQLELFDLATDPAEKTNLAAGNPQKVAELQQRIEALAREAVPPLILQEALGALKATLFGSVVLPDDEKALERQP